LRMPASRVYHWHRLLRPRHERPRDRGAAEQRDELAAPHARSSRPYFQ
jgi:hypothetical protein